MLSNLQYTNMSCLCKYHTTFIMFSELCLVDMLSSIIYNILLQNNTATVISFYDLYLSMVFIVKARKGIVALCFL